jgi:hypothetical protein
MVRATRKRTFKNEGNIIMAGSMLKYRAWCERHQRHDGGGNIQMGWP